MAFSLLSMYTAAAHASDKPAAPEQPVIRVATLNLAHGRGLATEQLGHDRATFETNIDRIADAVRAHAPDVLALQEADAASAWSGAFDHVRRLADRCECQHVFHGLHFDIGLGELRVAYGTALLSHMPLQSAESHRFRHGPLHSKGFVLADVDFDGAPLTIVSLHFHSGSGDVRKQQAAEVIDLLKDRKQSLVVMGDFNATWSHKNDAVRAVAAGLNLTPHDPDSANDATFRSTAPRKRLDWILISNDLSFISYRSWPELVSDHLGVEAEIRRDRKE